MVRSIGKIAVKLTLLTLITGLPAAVQASEPAPIAGVWEGTLGTQEIRACFNEQDWGPSGAYYYLQHLNAIPLQQSDKSAKTFVEGYSEADAKMPRWTIVRSDGNELSARWAQGPKNLPVELTRIAGVKLGENESPCGSLAFHSPRLVGVRVLRKPATKDGLRYTRLVLDTRGHFGDDVSLETFELSGGTPAIRKINAALAKPFSARPAEWFDCMLGAAPRSGDYHELHEPRMVTRRWLVVTDSWDSSCGGNHPNSLSVARAFDMQTGQQVDVAKWLNKRVGTPAFRRLFFANGGRNDKDCKEVVEQSVRAFSLDIELKKSGLGFTPSDLPHVVQACGDESFISFAKLQPYLNAEGKKNVAALLTELGEKR